MAGQFFEVSNPGYATLWTRDLPYDPNVAGGEVAGYNPLDPASVRPLIEGEWLEMASSGRAVTRGGSNAVGVPGTPDNERVAAAHKAPIAFPYFAEKGRYDVQNSKLCHLITGPHGFEFRTKVCNTAFNALEVGDPVSVWDLDTITTGVIRRGLAKASATGHIVGYVIRVWGTNDISVLYMPQAA